MFQKNKKTVRYFVIGIGCGLLLLRPQLIPLVLRIGIPVLAVYFVSKWLFPPKSSSKRQMGGTIDICPKCGGQMRGQGDSCIKCGFTK